MEKFAYQTEHSEEKATEQSRKKNSTRKKMEYFRTEKVVMIISKRIMETDKKKVSISHDMFSFLGQKMI